MVEFTFNVNDTIRSLEKFSENWQKNARVATKKTFGLLVKGIVKETLKYRDPEPLYYIRTLRLVNGWQKASTAVDVDIPGPRPHAQIDSNDSEMSVLENENEITFTATNNVPYALAVEDTGTIIAKEQGGGRRPPYKNVFTPTETLRQNQALEILVARAWNETKAE